MNLKIGDKIRITSIPGENIDGYTIHKDTVTAYKKLIKRNRSVTINKIDENGIPWFRFRLKNNGRWETHLMNILEDNNWVKVKSRS